MGTLNSIFVIFFMDRGFAKQGRLGALPTDHMDKYLLRQTQFFASKELSKYTRQAGKKYDKDRWGEIQWNHRCPLFHMSYHAILAFASTTLYIESYIYTAIALQHENIDFNMVWHFVKVEPRTITNLQKSNSTYLGQDSYVGGYPWWHPDQLPLLNF